MVSGIVFGGGGDAGFERGGGGVLGGRGFCVGSNGSGEFFIAIQIS